MRLPQISLFSSSCFALVGLLCVLSPRILLSVSAQNDDLICPDASLTEYLIALIDVLFANGLTVYENLIVHYSELDNGYQLLHDLYTSGEKVTMLVPTDSAWGEVGIWPPFVGLTDDWGVELGELHALRGDISYASLPESGHNIASTWLSLASEYNLTDDGSISNARQAVSLARSDNNAIVIDGWWGNASSWSGPVDTSSQGSALSNLVILPIDQVLSFPPSVGEALTTSGLSNMSSALGVVGKADEVEQLTSGGFTIFVPVDDVWTNDVREMMGDGDSAWTIVGSHYTTSYTLFSPFWTESGSFDLPVESGATLTVRAGSASGSEAGQDGSTVTLGEVEARIVKSDITLRNGVMHIIDKVLVSNSSTPAAPATPGGTGSKAASSPSATSTGGTKDKPSIPGTNDDGDTGSDDGENSQAIDDPSAPRPPSAATRSLRAVGGVYLGALVGVVSMFGGALGAI
ncbi:hypothetical protein I317_03479 [Kwoniella heveanensis CBS 569]|nr:hypothetical protein I317_03479 [Kwoniella heveanensis CBS 569]